MSTSNGGCPFALKELKEKALQNLVEYEMKSLLTFLVGLPLSRWVVGSFGRGVGVVNCMNGLLHLI